VKNDKLTYTTIFFLLKGSSKTIWNFLREKISSIEAETKEI